MDGENQYHSLICTCTVYCTKSIALHIVDSCIGIRKVLICIIRWCPYFKNSKIAPNSFCDKTLHIYSSIRYIYSSINAGQ